MNPQPTPAELQIWFPQKWSEFAGNRQLKETLIGLLENGVCNTLVTGWQRTGKTRMISHFLKALCCPHRNAEHDPCGKCPTCKSVGNARWEHSGAFKESPEGYGFVAIDCLTVTRERLNGLTSEVDLESLKTIVYLDEVQALGERNLEGSLLKLMDESPATFIASAIALREPAASGLALGLTPPMLDRFHVKAGTWCPDDAELRQWIEDRCRAWAIELEAPGQTLDLVVRRSENVVGRAMTFLVNAAHRGRRLDPRLAKELELSPLD